METLVVLIENGIVKHVLAKEVIPDMQVMLVDMDIDMAGAEELTMIPTIDSSDIPAFVSIEPIQKATLDWDIVLNRYMNNIHPTEEELDEN